MKIQITSKEPGVTAEILLDGKPLEMVREYKICHVAGKLPTFYAEILPQITELTEEETVVYLRIGTRVFKVLEEI